MQLGNPILIDVRLLSGCWSKHAWHWDRIGNRHSSYLSTRSIRHWACNKLVLIVKIIIVVSCEGIIFFDVKQLAERSKFKSNQFKVRDDWLTATIRRLKMKGIKKKTESGSCYVPDRRVEGVLNIINVYNMKLFYTFISLFILIWTIFLCMLDIIGLTKSC